MSRAAAFIVGGILCLLLLSSSAVIAADVTPDPRMMRTPDVSRTQIVFVYADDLWVAPKEGGVAMPLASPPGMESMPRFSPDGATIGFVGNYDGNRDIYVISATGGIPVRVTHHPASEVLADWTPDGELLFFSNALAGIGRLTQLFRVSPEGGLPEALPVPYGTWAGISPDGEWLAYTPSTRDHRTWKRYMGGLASDIWLFHLTRHEARKITDWGGTDTQPMWHGAMLYYLSDGGPNHRLNIWSYDPRTEKHEQITSFRRYDVKWPAVGPGTDGAGEIVFQCGSDLYLLDLRSRESRKIEVTIPGARPTIRPKTENANDFIQSWSISPTGKRAVASARGDVWTLPAENGTPRNLTRSSGTAERYPAWSPDGRHIAYFGDREGEYDLYITPSDGKGETKRLTDQDRHHLLGIEWSPDSKMITYHDQRGVMYLHTIESGETKEYDKDPVANGPEVSWSHDSRFLTYSKTSDDGFSASVWIYSVEEGTTQQVTSDLFADHSPVFDRKGDYLFFSSNRSFEPYYSDIDTTFIYADTEVLVAVPLRADQKSPWAPESDEETWGDDKEEKPDGDAKDNSDEREDSEEDDGESEDSEEDDGESEGDVDVPEDDGVSGTWEGKATGGPEFPPGGIPFTLELLIAADGSVSGTFTLPTGSASIDSGTYDRDSGELSASLSDDEGMTWSIRARVSGLSMTGTGTNETAGITVEFSAERTAARKPGDGEHEGKGGGKAREKVEIEFEGFERRALLLPVPRGSFGALAVNDKNQLIYARLPMQGSDGSAAIHLFDLEDEKQEEKKVASGARGFAISADGKKILTVQGSTASIQNAAAGASGKSVVTQGMLTTVEPRAEWAQLLRDSWRLMRDYFYDPDMHGVDWDAVYDYHAAMIDDCATRRDVSFVIGEMISELNVGHAYYSGGDVDDDEPNLSVGLLGADYSLENGAYRIAVIYEGGPWDLDARGPLSQPGVEVSAGDYLLAVNGIPLPTDRDPWAAFQGLAGQVTTLTVSAKPSIDEDAREVIVKALGSESNLRYRAWIEKNRKYVSDRTGGRVGYIYVPNTGVNGQNDLVRQYSGQLGKAALIIDERWNGGGQIPTRFIEMLNRPITNYWARPHSIDWTWPPDAHRGPKCMLINGAAGSGGDAFPAYFRKAGLGMLIGMRTWGGLVGLSGNPPLIDGGSVRVPTFGYYDTDGTWGIEGYGVAPDLEVIDDPSKMVEGGDPQLDAAVQQMLREIDKSPYVPALKPRYPDRSGMGIQKADQ